jgi:F0F1-type ATP synthase epsilon subunit
VSGKRFEPRTSRIKSRHANCYEVIFGFPDVSGKDCTIIPKNAFCLEDSDICRVEILVRENKK